MWFTSVGLGWTQPGPEPVHAVVRVGADRTSFGAATQIESVPDEGPDPWMPDFHPLRKATDLLWTGGGRCIRFSLRLPGGIRIRDLHAVFMNTSGTSAGPTTGPPQAEPLPSAAGGISAPSTGGVTPTSTTPPTIHSRAAWGADPRYFNTGTPGCRSPYYAPETKVAYVHHTSGSNAYSPAQADDIVRSIYFFHTQERGYCDIAYSFLISRYGQIFVGRAGGADLPVVPGSQSGFNTYTFSAAVMGNFQEVPPPSPALDALKRLLAWRLDVAHVPAQGHATLVSQGGETARFKPGTKVTLRTIVGHRQTSYTDCPGHYLFRLLPAIRSAVAAMGQPKILRPTQSRLRLRPGRNDVTLKAKATDPLRWTVTVKGLAGRVFRTLRDRGRYLAVTWGGKDERGRPVPAGKYRLIVSGANGGAEARPAMLPLIVVGPEVTGPAPTGMTASPAHSSTASPAPAAAGGFRMLKGVDAAAPRLAWAVGGSAARTGRGHAVVLRWNGRSWSAVAAPDPGTSAFLNDVVAPAKDAAWAAGFTCDDPLCVQGGFGTRNLILGWDGRRWTTQPTPNPGTGANQLVAVDAASPEDVWAIGTYFDDGIFQRQPLFLHFDGERWSEAEGPFISNVDGRVLGLDVRTTDDVWVVGHQCVGACAPLIRSKPLILHWNGSRWSSVRPPDLHVWNSQLEAVAATSERSVWAAGSIQRERLSKTQPLLLHWDGRRWGRIKTPHGGNQGGLFAVETPSRSGVWAAGTDGFGTATYRTLALRRTDRGWRPVSTPSPSVRMSFLSDVAALSSTSMWAVGPSLGGTVVLRWNGSRWRSVAAP